MNASIAQRLRDEQRRRHTPGDSGETAGGETDPQTFTTWPPAGCHADSQRALSPGHSGANPGVPEAGKGPAEEATPPSRLEGCLGRSQEAKDIVLSISSLHGENPSRRMIIFLEIVHDVFSAVPSSW